MSSMLSFLLSCITVTPGKLPSSLLCLQLIQIFSTEAWRTQQQLGQTVTSHCVYFSLPETIFWDLWLIWILLLGLAWIWKRFNNTPWAGTQQPWAVPFLLNRLNSPTWKHQKSFKYIISILWIFLSESYLRTRAWIRVQCCGTKCAPKHLRLSYDTAFWLFLVW